MIDTKECCIKKSFPDVILSLIRTQILIKKQNYKIKENIKMTNSVKNEPEIFKIIDLEKDILTTANELFKQPFSRKDAQNKIEENDKKHFFIALAIYGIPGIVCKSGKKCSETEIKNTLEKQLFGMIVFMEKKEIIF